jgi:hypothetical protein
MGPLLSQEGSNNKIVLWTIVDPVRKDRNPFLKIGFHIHTDDVLCQVLTRSNYSLLGWFERKIGGESNSARRCHVACCLNSMTTIYLFMISFRKEKALSDLRRHGQPNQSGSHCFAISQALCGEVTVHLTTVTEVLVPCIVLPSQSNCRQ